MPTKKIKKVVRKSAVAKATVRLTAKRDNSFLYMLVVLLVATLIVFMYFKMQQSY